MLAALLSVASARPVALPPPPPAEAPSPLRAAPPTPPPPMSSSPVVLTRVTAAQIAQALQDKGYRAEISAQDGGDLRVITSMSGTGVFVNGYDCDRATPQTCGSVQILWGAADEWNTSLATVNAWNHKKRYIQAVVTPEHVVQLLMDVQFFGGNTLGNLSANFGTYDDILGEYLRWLEEKRGP